MPTELNAELRSRIELSGNLLMLVGGLGLLSALAFAVYSVVMLAIGIMAASDAGGDAIAQIIGQTVGFGCSVVMMLGLSGLVLVGGLRMKQLRSYGLALAASVLAMLPCTSACCVIGLPVGILGLVTLMDEEVKEAFGQAALAA